MWFVPWSCTLLAAEEQIPEGTGSSPFETYKRVYISFSFSEIF